MKPYRDIINRAMWETRSYWRSHEVPFDYKIDHFEHNMIPGQTTHRLIVGCRFDMGSYVPVVQLDYVGEEAQAWEQLLHMFVRAGWQTLYESKINFDRNEKIKMEGVPRRAKDWPLNLHEVKLKEEWKQVNFGGPEITPFFTTDYTAPGMFEFIDEILRDEEE